MAEEGQRAIFHEYQTQMTRFRQVGVCNVCDTWQRAPELHEMDIEQLPITHMCARLRPPAGLGPALVEQYECTQLPGLMLSRKGFVGAGRAWICRTCLASLRKRDANDKPPSWPSTAGSTSAICHPRLPG